MIVSTNCLCIHVSLLMFMHRLSALLRVDATAFSQNRRGGLS
jgi:hypothetical protein